MDLNNYIYACAVALKDEYADVAIAAKKASQKFSRAIDVTLDYSIRRYGEREDLK